MREDFGDLDKAEFLYRSGFDREGRTIVVFIGCFLPAKKVSLERLFLYFLRTMDAVVEREYVIVYVAVNQSGENRPSFAWLRRVYSLFNRKYKKVSRLASSVSPIITQKSKHIPAEPEKAVRRETNDVAEDGDGPVQAVRLEEVLGESQLRPDGSRDLRHPEPAAAPLPIGVPRERDHDETHLRRVTRARTDEPEQRRAGHSTRRLPVSHFPFLQGQSNSFPSHFLHAMPFYALCRMNESNRTFPSQTNRRSNWKESSAFLGIASRPTSSG